MYLEEFRKQELKQTKARRLTARNLSARTLLCYGHGSVGLDGRSDLLVWTLYKLRAKFRLGEGGGPIGEYIGCQGGPIKGFTTNLVQGS